jgi:peptide/nickel transport system ATP-binding protein/oligopeptide transport system ATP-binding protein
MANLITVDDLKVHFVSKQGLLSQKIHTVKAVDSISFCIPKGKTVGLVGESGSGKSTTGKAIARLVPMTGGSIHYNENNISELSNKEFYPYRKKIQMVFQDPFGSLNPRMSIGSSISEPMTIHLKALNETERKDKVAYLLNKVGLSADMMARFPHEFSGGQRQRIGIARAIAAEPEFIICDEPVSALDVSVQAHIINLLKDLQSEFNLTYLFVAHDLAVIEHMSDTILVMTEGKIVEQGDAKEVCRNPKHPYTQKLLEAVPLI